jgi:uncharacterized membrane protein
MDLIIALVVTTLISWLLGFFQILPWVTLPVAVSWGLAVLFILTGISHFAPMRKDMVRMVPSIFPFPAAIVFITGVLELLGVIGLLLPMTRFWAALCLVVLLIAMFPANIKAAVEKISLRGKPAQSLWTRLPEQIFFIALLLFVAFAQ